MEKHKRAVSGIDRLSLARCQPAERKRKNKISHADKKTEARGEREYVADWVDPNRRGGYPAMLPIAAASAQMSPTAAPQFPEACNTPWAYRGSGGFTRLLHAISGPPAALVLFALSSPAAGLAGLFVLISTMFAKELTSGDGSPCVFSYDAERMRPSGGGGERMTSGTKPVLPAAAVTLAAEGICAAEKLKGSASYMQLYFPRESVTFLSPQRNIDILQQAVGHEDGSSNCHVKPGLAEIWPSGRDGSLSAGPRSWPPAPGPHRALWSCVCLKTRLNPLKQLSQIRSQFSRRRGHRGLQVQM
ncbi:hypothetical protein EYF80_008986 [Liparis tanakae]|uniref:Uncharacterized protein n=1 Tax=Liparis tanakae TaxID=230148 RepID=A0A4Z2ITV9_9TELE|nr:hypothetical protein EYF80_008986 [Liparis tanakae]